MDVAAFETTLNGGDDAARVEELSRPLVKESLESSAVD